MSKILIVFCFILLFASCEEDENFNIAISHEAYSFISYSESIGHTIKLKNLKINVGHSLSGAHYNPNNHTITIDTSSIVWKNFPEETIAHEMGHALLRRQHDFGRMRNGMYKSIMGNYSSPSYGGWSHHDTTMYRKEYYFRELFNESIEPFW